MSNDDPRVWILEPNPYTDEEVRAFREERARVQAAIGGPMCQNCGMYLSLHGENCTEPDPGFS